MKAQELAYKAHKGQKRKYTEEPYFNHVASVARMVSEILPGNSDAVEIAYLHDVLEDTEVTYEELEEEFGFEVASRVLALSDLNKDGNRASRKAGYAAQISTSDSVVHTIKLCDLIDNTRTIVVFDPKFAKTYIPEKKEMIKACWKSESYLLKTMAESLVEISEKMLAGLPPEKKVKK